MNKAEAEELAAKMTYRDAINNALAGKCIPYRKATMIKLHRLLDLIEPRKRGYTSIETYFDEFMSKRNEDCKQSFKKCWKGSDEEGDADAEEKADSD